MSTLARLFVSLVLLVSTLDRAFADNLPGHDYLKSCEKMVQMGSEARLDDSKANPMIEALKEFLNNEIIGQGPAIESLGEAIEMMTTFLNDPEKPMARYFFLGPTGVGKTELVRALVRYLKGNPDKNMIRFDGGELQFDHEISRIIGTTSGYKGYGDKPGLHPENVEGVKLIIKLDDGKTIEFSIILFDEIEKASEAVQKLLLGILDNGKVTLGDNTPSVLRKTMVIATSNLGAKEVEQLIEARKMAIEAKRAAGQTVTEAEADLTGRKDKDFRQMIYDTYMGAITKRFSPEFKNRWQKFIQFLHLERSNFLGIADVMLAKLQKRIYQRTKTKFDFQLTPKAKEWLVDKGTDFRNGARELGNLIEFQITRRFARLLATGQIVQGDVLLIDVAGEGDEARLTFNRIATGLDEVQLKTFADQVYPGKKLKDVKFGFGTDEDIKDNASVVASLLKTMSDYPLAMSSLWQWAEKSEASTENVSAANSSSAADTITYKIVKVDGILVRVYYSTREIQTAQKKR